MTDPNSMIPPQVAAVVAQDQRILDVFGMEITAAADGECTMRCVVPENLINAAGFAHGSIAFSLMDTACAYALGSLAIRGVTINGSTTYVSGAEAGSVLNTKVWVVSRTRRIVSLQGEVFIDTDEGEKLAAHGSFVFQLIEVRT